MVVPGGSPELVSIPCAHTATCAALMAVVSAAAPPSKATSPLRAKCASASHAVFAATADASSACDDDDTPSHTTSTVHGSPFVMPEALATASSLCGRRSPGSHTP